MLHEVENTILMQNSGYNFSVEGRRSLISGGHTPMSKLTWVDQKHHKLLSPWGARVLNFSTMIYPPNPDIEKVDIADRPDLERFF